MKKKHETKLNEFCAALIELATKVLLEGNSQTRVTKIITISVQSALNSQKEGK